MTGKTSHGFLPNGLWRLVLAAWRLFKRSSDGRREKTNPDATRLADRFDCARQRWWSAPDGASIRGGADQQKEMGRRCAWGRQHRPGTGDRGIRPLELFAGSAPLQWRIHCATRGKSGTGVPLSQRASVLVVGFLAAVHQGAGEDAGILADLLLNGPGDLGMFLEIGLGVLAALADALAVIGEPRARLLDDAGLLTEIDQFAGLAHALAVHDVELDDLEGRRHLVLHDFHARGVADHLVAVLERADAADVEPNRG